MTVNRNIICMKWGDKFGSEYVNRLFRMVEKNLTLEHRFVCFTDNDEGLDPKIEVRSIPEFPIDPCIPDKGWKKLTVFSEHLADLEGQAMFLDLDIVIRSNINCFFEEKGDFIIIKDWDFPKNIIGNSSVFRFEIGKHQDVLDNFFKIGKDIRNFYKNEQAYLSYEMHRKGILKYWNKDWCVSFKRQCLQKFPMNFFKMPEDPQNAKIIIFHGRPTPEQAYKGFCGKMGLRYVKPTVWLDKYWELS